MKNNSHATNNTQWIQACFDDVKSLHCATKVNRLRQKHQCSKKTKMNLLKLTAGLNLNAIIAACCTSSSLGSRSFSHKIVDFVLQLDQSGSNWMLTGTVPECFRHITHTSTTTAATATAAATTAAAEPHIAAFVPRAQEHMVCLCVTAFVLKGRRGETERGNDKSVVSWCREMTNTRAWRTATSSTYHHHHHHHHQRQQLCVI